MRARSKVMAIINPTSGGGLGRRSWPKIQRYLDENLDSFDMEETTAMGDARKIAAEASKQGYSLIIACGGDGTIHEVANGIRDAEASEKTRMGIISVGTGGDFVKTLGLPKSLEEQARIAVNGNDRVIDLGRIDYSISKDKKESRHFINIASAGLGAEVVRRIHRSRALFGKKLAYLGSTLEAYFSWSPSPVLIHSDGAARTPLPEKPLIIVVANGRFFGGGMPIATKADPTDGWLDLVVVGGLNPLKIPLALSLLYTKRFYDLDEVYYDRVRTVTLTAKGPVDLDIDGEPIGALPATFQIVPKALTVRVP